MPKHPKNAPLTVKVVNDQLVISIGVSTLAFAAQGAPDGGFIVSNEKGFAKDVVRTLKEECSRLGQSTMVERMLDEAFDDAYESGSKHVNIGETP